MILTPQNSSYPPFWGKEINKVNNRWTIQTPKVEIPAEFDFFNEYCGKDTQNAKEYYKTY